MARVRFRVYPAGFNSLNANRTAMRYAASAIRSQANVKLMAAHLQNEKRTSALRIGYERQIFNERLKRVELQSALKYGRINQFPPNYGYGYGGFGVPFGGIPAAVPAPYGNAMFGGFNMGNGFFNSLGLGGLF